MGLNSAQVTACYSPTTDPAYLRSIKRHCFFKGLAISDAVVGNRFTQPDPEQRKLQMNMVCHWIACAALLDAPGLRVFAEAMPDGYTEEEAIHWIADVVKKCVPVAAPHGVMLALENHGGITSTAQQVSRIISVVGSNWIAVNLDMGNFDVLNMTNPYDELARLIPLAVTCQFKSTLSK